jgi:succinyl-diaminopimelate desuccinylase
MDERALAERLITYDTSKPEALRAGAAFIKGWLEARDIDVRDRDFDGLPVVLADVGAPEGLRGDFAVTGEPTDLHIGVQAKGVLAARVEVVGTAAHGSTPWLGDNAILKAHDTFRRIETLPFSRESSDMFDRPSINLARIDGGDAFNKVPDTCTMDVDIRFLPNQDPGDILAQIRAIPDLRIVKTFTRAPALVSRRNPYVLALRDAVGRSIEGEALSVGRDGASDAISFLEAGVPAVEFGPIGGGHHGPHEWVSISSLARYRRALGDFVRHLPAWLERQEQPLRAVEGGLA